MEDKVYTLLDLAEEFGKDKQFIRRRISTLKLSSINKDSREHINEPLEYSRSTYLKLAEEFGVSVLKNDSKNETHDDTQSNTHETHDDMNKDKVIEVLERELKHSKDKLNKSEEEKETLMRLLDQQQRLSLQANQKIEVLELEVKENSDPEEEKGEKKVKKRKWYDIFKKKV